MGAGVIDAQYRGEIKVLLFNHSDKDFSIEPGDRIAQLLIQKVESIHFLQVNSLDNTQNETKEDLVRQGKSRRKKGLDTVLNARIRIRLD